MDVIEAIHGRRSVRSYEPKPVERDLIESLIVDEKIIESGSFVCRCPELNIAETLFGPPFLRRTVNPKQCGQAKINGHLGVIAYSQSQASGRVAAVAPRLSQLHPIRPRNFILGKCWCAWYRTPRKRLSPILS